VNFDYFGALMFRKQNRHSGLVSRRAARQGEVNAIVRQIPRQHNHLDVSFRRRHRANLLLRIRAAGSAMVIPAPAAAWVSAPILPTRKVPVIFLRRDGSLVTCSNRIFLMNFDEFR
jgi:hypothetical protein